MKLIRQFPVEVLAAYFRNELIERPKFWAEQTGIEQLGYWTDLPKPTPSPSLIEVGSLYFDKAKVKPRWLARSREWWTEFCGSVDAQTLREISQEMVADYKSDVLETQLSDNRSTTYVKHRFGAVKTMIAYSKHWGLWADDRTKALGYCSILIPPKSVTPNPAPIERSHFHTLLSAGDDNMDALLLLALNFCMYGHEVACLEWSDFDFDKKTLVTDRTKTGVARIGVMWDRTIDALNKLARFPGIKTLMLTDGTRQPHNANTFGKAFRDLRTATGVPDTVKLCHVRDGSYTAAAEGEQVQYEHARILGGHRLGMSDAYIKRRPKLVADACKAIELAYFG